MMRVRAFRPDDSERWDTFCAASYGATFLHSRRFLSYHGDRFADRSLIIEDEGGRWLGLLPLALDPVDATRWVSHPGITYGGVLHDGVLRGAAMVGALESACALMRERGARRLIVKPVPYIYALAPAQDDVYALYRLDAQRVRCDLTSCIDLAHPLPRSERRRRGLKKAQRANLAVESGVDQLDALWPVIEENLARSHGLQPVHTLAQMQVLATRFPRHIACRVARHEKRVVAGLVLFVTPRVTHAQYIASSEEGQALCALDLLFDHAIGEAQVMQQRYFNFGVSTEDGGRMLNEGLHRFKSEFGTGGVVHEHHEVML